MGADQPGRKVASPRSRLRRGGKVEEPTLSIFFPHHDTPGDNAVERRRSSAARRTMACQRRNGWDIRTGNAASFS